MADLYSKQIFKLIPKHAKVLDLGCGDGRILEILKRQKKCDVYGIDIDFKNIVTCVQKGLSVFHGNIDEGLSEFPDKCFDYVIISETIQQVQKPLYVISEMLRVGQKAIVTFPNFGHWSIRYQILKGVAPNTKTLPYQWFDTPNIRVLSIKDFRNLCKQNGFKIIKEVPLRPIQIPFLSRLTSNLLAKRGMFILQK